jgi:hypothetical protein
MSEQSLPPYGEPASRQLLTHLARREFPYGSPPVKRDVGARRHLQSVSSVILYGRVKS